MSKDDKNLVPHRSELPDANESLKRVPSEILDNLSPKQQKAATMLVTTTLNERQVAEVLGISKRKLTMWMKDDYFQALINHTQQRLYQNDVEVTKAQLKLVRERVFTELMGRFEDYSEENLPDNASVSEIMLEKKRHAYFADFKDVVRAYLEIDKRMTDNRKSETFEEEADAVWERVQERFRKKTIKRKQRAQAYEDSGIGGEDFFNIMDINPDGTVTPNMEVIDKISDEPFNDEVEEEHEVVVEQIKLKRRKDND